MTKRTITIRRAYWKGEYSQMTVELYLINWDELIVNKSVEEMCMTFRSLCDGGKPAGTVDLRVDHRPAV